MNTILAAIRAGAAMPVTVLPGELGAHFVRRLFDDAGRNWPQATVERFRLLRNACQCANDAANHHQDAEARRWISLSSSLLPSLEGQALAIARSCVLFNEAYVHFAASRTAESLQALRKVVADENMDPLPGAQQDKLRHLRRLHALHLEGRVLLGAGKPDQAISVFVSALEESAQLLPEKPEIGDLLEHSSSRLCGELAIAAASYANPLDYLQATEGLAGLQVDGMTEYQFFRTAGMALWTARDPGPLADFVRLGRMKTICWYAAVAELASHLNRAERQVLALYAGSWRDMPAALRRRLITLAIDIPSA